MSERSAPQWLIGYRAAFVVAQTRFVVGEEHLAGQVTAAAHPGFAENALEGLPDCVSRQRRRVGDLGGGVALQHQLGDLSTTLLLAGVPVHVAAARLGHADPAVTLRVYSHVLREHAQGVGDVFARAIQASVSKSVSGRPRKS